MVQKVVDTILRNTASKDGGESSKGAEGSTKAEWKDDTASKIILTGFKVCKVVSFDHSQWHGLITSRLITVAKQPWSGLIHGWVTICREISIHGKPSVFIIQSRNTSLCRIACAEVPDKGL